MKERKARLPLWLRRRIEVERHGISQFIEEASRELPTGSWVLDAGAGDGRFRSLFQGKAYISLDLPRSEKEYGDLDLIADLHHLPIRENALDAILCTQVLEHVRDPRGVLTEFHRVLRDGGNLHLTVPQGAPEHEVPHDYYRFTRYALEDLFLSAGFSIRSIKPLGGYFLALGHQMRVLPRYVTRNRIFQAVLEPFFSVALPLLCFYLDRFDRTKNYSITYLCRCRKGSRELPLSESSRIPR
jgi:SAM-dependent methyltransferase